jgi:hypothetical protein
MNERADWRSQVDQLDIFDRKQNSEVFFWQEGCA